jgi:hypothetical protein
MDTFYIDDPTLGFINGVYWDLVLIFPIAKTFYLVNMGPYYFTYPEYTSLAMAKVWAGKADFPCTAELWHRYDKVVEDRGGYRKNFHLLDDDGLKGKFHFIILFLAI